MHQINLEEGKLLRVAGRNDGKPDMAVYVDGNPCLTACTLTLQGDMVAFICYQINKDGTLKASKPAGEGELATMLFERFQHPAKDVLVVGYGEPGDG